MLGLKLNHVSKRGHRDPLTGRQGSGPFPVINGTELPQPLIEMHSLILSLAPGDCRLAHASSLQICLSSSPLESQRLQGNRNFWLDRLSSTSISLRCHAAPKPVRKQEEWIAFIHAEALSLFVNLITKWKEWVVFMNTISLVLNS